MIEVLSILETHLPPAIVVVVVIPAAVLFGTPQVAKLRQQLDVKAEEMAGVGMVMVHDLLVLTNDFLADKDREDSERGKRGSKESLFEKMVTEEQRQRERRVRLRAAELLWPDLT